MNPKIKNSLFLFSLIAAISIMYNPAFAAGWKAGVSSALITPQEPMITAGYGGRTEPASGKISDLYIKALAIEDPSGEKVVIVTSDFIGFYPYELAHEIAAKIERKWHIPRKSILFNASHTHCGPDITGSAGNVKVYREQLKGKFEEIIDNSLNNLSPANFTFSTARPTPFAVSRRFPDGKGGVLYRSTPSAYYTEGPRDDISPVLKVSAPDGKIIAILFGYTCHPITLNDNQYSADYPGFAQQYLQEAYPGATAMFMQGCAGQLVPNSRYQVQYAMGHGRALADAVGRSVEGAQTPISGPIRTAYKEVRLHFSPLPDKQTLEDLQKNRNEETSKAASLLLEKMARNETIDLTCPAPLQAVSFGPELLLVAFSGEPVAEYSVNSKKEFYDRAKFVWAAGYNNYHFGYLATLNVLREGGYEVTSVWSSPVPRGSFDQDVEDIVMSGMKDIVNTVTR